MGENLATLVFGGAGYIGSHIVKELIEAGQPTVVIDDFSTGNADAVAGVEVLETDLSKSESVKVVARALDEYGVDAVIHLAAKKQVGESVARPAWYYQQNVGGLANVLLAMELAGVANIVFSSSAAVYGNTETDLVNESHPTRPVSPYGETKLHSEHLLNAQVATGKVNAISLRYFNVAGASTPELGDRMALNLIPMVFERLKQGFQPRIFGDDYPTADGTCVRDYIHVTDLARAHLSALHALRAGTGRRHTAYNIGTGVGTSVKEIVDLVRTVSGIDVEPEVTPRRPGDPARIVADPSRAMNDLGWQASKSQQDMVESAWASFQYLNRNGMLSY